MSKVQASGNVVAFISKVQSASNRKASEVKLSIQEAIDLSASISLMLARQNTLLEDIVELQKRATSGPTEIALDGGGFDKD